jgi:hypothetical protein
MPSAADVLQISCKREQDHQVYLNVLPSAAEILRRRKSQQKNSKAMYRDIYSGKNNGKFSLSHEQRKLAYYAMARKLLQRRNDT